MLSSSLTVSLAHGFAVTASQPIGEGEVLLRVPQRLVLSADGAVAALPGILDRGTEAHVSLAAWLMKLTERPPHPLRSYLASLSAAEIDCTLLWRPDELGLLQASAASRRAATLRAWADDEWSRLFGGGGARPGASFNTSAATANCFHSYVVMELETIESDDRLRELHRENDSGIDAEVVTSAIHGYGVHVQARRGWDKWGPARNN